MTITSHRELAVTQEKLKMLEEEYEKSRTSPVVSQRVREHTLRSLKQLINEMKEQVVRFEATRIRS